MNERKKENKLSRPKNKKKSFNSKEDECLIFVNFVFHQNDTFQRKVHDDNKFFLYIFAFLIVAKIIYYGRCITPLYTFFFSPACSHLRSIRHYIVYEKEQDGQLLYYIFPKCPRFTSLADLIRDCQLRGIVEHSETKPKTFKTPDGKEALRFGSGRFSHVRLRVAIPSRRR